MKIVCVLILALAACCIAAEPTWNPADAAKEADRTFALGISSFIGRIALRPAQWVSRSR